MEDNILENEEQEIQVKEHTSDKRRKNEWKFAKRRLAILENKHCVIDKKPLHYYSKNSPLDSYASEPNKTNNKGSRRYISKNYKPYKNYNERDQKQIDSYEEQLEEVLAEE